MMLYNLNYTRCFYLIGNVSCLIQSNYPRWKLIINILGKYLVSGHFVFKKYFIVFDKKTSKACKFLNIDGFITNHRKLKI